MFVDEVKYFSLKYAWNKRLFHVFVASLYLNVCSFHATCAFQSEYTLCSCLNFKEIFAQNRRGIYLNVPLRFKWLWIEILLQPLGLIFDDVFGPRKKGLYWHLKIYAIISWISQYNSILGLKNGFHVLYSVSIWT